MRYFQVLRRSSFVISLALIGLGTQAPAIADGILPIPSADIIRAEIDVVTAAGEAPCRRRVKLSYQRNDTGSYIDQWYFLTEPCDTDHYSYPEATDPQAILLLFSGGAGRLFIDAGEPGSSNFVVRQRYAFTAAGPFVVAVIDAASDFLDNAMAAAKACKTATSGGGLRTCRFSEDHMIDVANVIQDLRATDRFAHLPVWLVGTSRGTISAVAAAELLDPAYGPNGLVLTAPVINDSDPNESVLAADLSQVTVPVQIIAHKDDECSVSMIGGNITNPNGLASLTSGLTQAEKVKTALVQGGYPAVGENCGPLSPHGFFGIERKVTRKLANFIRRLSD